MSSFVCRVIDSKGNRLVIRRDATHPTAVVRDLNQEGFFILSVRPVSQSSTVPVRRLKPAVVLEFTQILATLMANGLRLKEALTIAKKLGGAAVAPLLSEVEEKVGKGDSLFEALSTWKSGFSSLYLGLVRIGEKTGDLGTIFSRLSEYLAGRQALRDKTISALVYPAFILVVALVGLVLLATFVLPSLTGMISSMNPKAAAIYKNNVVNFQVGAAVIVVILTLLGLFIAFAVGFRSKNATWAKQLDGFLLNVPWLKTFYHFAFGLNFAFAMETLLNSSYPLEEALTESAWVVGNLRFREGLLRSRESVVKGVPLSQALLQEKVFPQVLIGWMAVGEGAHDLVRSFTQVRSFYQKETDKFYSRLMNLAEPALIVVVGGIFLTLILTFITPIFTMMGNLL